MIPVGITQPTAPQQNESVIVSTPRQSISDHVPAAPQTFSAEFINTACKDMTHLDEIAGYLYDRDILTLVQSKYLSLNSISQEERVKDLFDSLNKNTHPETKYHFTKSLIKSDQIDLAKKLDPDFLKTYQDVQTAKGILATYREKREALREEALKFKIKNMSNS